MLEKAPTISVVIPLYNKEPHIRRAIQSVLNQSVKEFELIIVDDGSTDSSAKAASEIIDPRIKLIHQENAGVSAARNRGIMEARGELIAFLDADDEWMPDFLKTILHLVEKYPHCGAYATDKQIFYEDKSIKKIHDTLVNYPHSPWEGIIQDYFRSAQGPTQVMSSSVAIWKIVFNKIGLFPIGEICGEDVDLYCRIAFHFSIAYSSYCGANVYRDAVNRTETRHKIPEMYQSLIKTINYYLKLKKYQKYSNRREIIEYRNWILLYVAEQCYNTGYINEAKKTLLQASSTKRHRKVWLKVLLNLYLPVSFVQFIRNLWHKMK